MNDSRQVSMQEFEALVTGKKIFIFAVNLEGVGFAKLFSRKGFEVGGFIDSRSFPNNVKRGHPVCHPDDFFADHKPEDVVVVVSAKHRQTKRWAIDLCKNFGLKPRESYFVATELCDYMPTIEVSGICNLQCITCTMGVPGANKDGGFMSAATYRQVLGKMCAEIPFLNSVYLYLWGEPLINPEIAEIIRITSEHGVACEISTNLINAKHLEKVIEAQPEMLVVPCSGVGDNFELMRTGGKWEPFKKNLYEIRALLDKHHSDTVVRVHYHMYKHNMDEDYSQVEQMATELGFLFVPILAQIFPDYVLRNALYGEPIPEKMLCASEYLYYPIEDQLEYAKSNKDKYCFMVKAFPVVRWDASVIHCCNLSFPTVNKNYLGTSLEELLKERQDNNFCSECMAHGIHRYFDVDASVKVVDGKRTVQRGP